MQAVSGINQALAIRNEPAQASIVAALAKKQIDAAETAGGAVVELLQQATITAATAAAEVGQRIDVRV